MASPQIPEISEQEAHILYSKLNEYNRGRASYKEAGAYLVSLPRAKGRNYTLWLYSPLTERQSLLYICELSPDINASMRIASTMLYYSPRCIFVVAYNEKRMQSNGDDLISFGKYRGHFLHEIFQIDPSYIGWIAYKFIPKIPKQKRFVKIAQAYYSVHLDLMQRINKEKRTESRYLGELGEKITNLKLKVSHIRLEDDPYKTRVSNGRSEFYVKQRLTLHDTGGNIVQLNIPARFPSAVSGVLSGLEHAYQVGEIVYIASARVSQRYESRKGKCTCLSHVKITPFNASPNYP